MPKNFVPDLQPLVDALFQTDDADESDSIRELMLALQTGSPWPRIRKLRRRRILVDIAILGTRARLVKGTTLQE